MEWNAKVREFATENIDKEDMPKEVEEWIENNIPPEQMKSYFQRYYSYQMSDGIPYKFKNIAYEQDPKMQARLFRMHFGDIESIDDDELDALFENFAKLRWKPSKMFYIENARMNEEAKKEKSNEHK